MIFGNQCTKIKKSLKLSQTELDKKIGFDCEAYDQYERDEVMSFIEVATRISDVFDLSLVYLVGKSEQQLDQKTLRHIEEVSKMDDADQRHILSPFDHRLESIKGLGMIPIKNKL